MLPPPSYCAAVRPPCPPRYVFPDFNYQWLVDEIKENLPRELDFCHEADNAAKAAVNLASSRSRLGGRCGSRRAQGSGLGLVADGGEEGVAQEGAGLLKRCVHTHQVCRSCCAS